MPEPAPHVARRTIRGGYGHERGDMMKRVFLDRQKARHAPPPEPLPIDPRDPDIVRAKARIYRERDREKHPRLQR